MWLTDPEPASDPATFHSFHAVGRIQTSPLFQPTQLVEDRDGSCQPHLEKIRVGSLFFHSMYFLSLVEPTLPVPALLLSPGWWGSWRLLSASPGKNREDAITACLLRNVWGFWRGEGQTYFPAFLFIYSTSGFWPRYAPCYAHTRLFGPLRRISGRCVPCLLARLITYLENLRKVPVWGKIRERARDTRSVKMFSHKSHNSVALLGTFCHHMFIEYSITQISALIYTTYTCM